MKRFKLGTDFPWEGFVQNALEAYFRRLGYEVDTETDADLICLQPMRSERWLIEAKGATSSIGLDFRTGLGQLLQQMRDETTKYGIAVPDDPRFVRQCKRLSPWVRARLQLTIFLVSAAGSIRLIEPTAQELC